MTFRALKAFLTIMTSALVGAGVLCLLSVLPVKAQSIQITAPASGARVAPGATVPISVSLGPGVAVSQMIILGENPIGFSNPLTAAPFQFSITIPTAINAGLYHLTADATGPQGQDLQSTSIAIDVEPSVGIASFKVQPGLIGFRFVGDSLPVRVLGTLATGGQIDLTDSTLISYTSSKATVAAVSQTGVVSAVGPGSAYVTVSGPAVPFAIPVFVPSSVPPMITSLTASPNVLWPPNKKMVSVLLTASVSGSPAVCQISAVSSNQPMPGETEWVATGPLTLELMADRSGSGNGRVYTVTVTCTNSANLSATQTVTVSVPHDQGK